MRLGERPASANCGHETLPADAHRLGLEPAAGLARRDHDGFERRVRAHSRDERLARRFRRDVLILDVDEPLCAGDGGDGRALDLADLLVALFERRDRAHDADGQILEVRLRRAAAKRRARSGGRLRSGLPPACCQRVARSLAERGRRLALDDDLHVVHRHVRLATEIAAPRLRGVVGRDVPAAHGQVDAAAVRDVVVDDDELLVMRRADRQVTVEQDLDSLRFARAEDQARKELAVHRVEDRVVPQQDVNRRAAACASAASVSSLPSSIGAPSVGPRAPFQPRAAV